MDWPTEDRRGAVLDRVAAELCARVVEHPLRVAVEGLTASGKSTFAAGLAAAVAGRGRAALHLSTDDFHHVSARRHRNADPAAGYYQDAYDFDSFARLVLIPLGPGGSFRIKRRVHDVATDELLDDPWHDVDHTSIVVVDGSFLRVPQLADQWDVSIWLDVDSAVAVERAVRRDLELFGSVEAVRGAYATRYHAAFGLYIGAVDPAGSADFVVANDDPAAPTLKATGTAGRRRPDAVDSR